MGIYLYALYYGNTGNVCITMCIGILPFILHFLNSHDTRALPKYPHTLNTQEHTGINTKGEAWAIGGRWYTMYRIPTKIKKYGFLHHFAKILIYLHNPFQAHNSRKPIKDNKQ